MSSESPQIRHFSKFRLDVQKKVLWHEHEPVNLPLKEIELLCVLTENGGGVVTKSELLEKLWADSFVEESNLPRHIYLLRKTFREFGESEELIQTVPRRGYRFAGEVREIRPGELVIEKHSLTRTLIEEIPAASTSMDARNLLSRRPGRAVVVTMTVLILAALVAAAIVVKRGGVTAAGPKRLAVGPGANVEAKALAVMPFVNFAPGYTAKNSSSAMNLTSALIARLESEPLVNITPPDAVSTEKMSWNNMLVAGRALQADAVLTGALFASDPDIYLRMHLVSINGGEVLWSTTYKHPANELPALMDSIAAGVRSGLHSLRNPEEYERIARRHTSSRDAYQLYLQGRFRWNMRGDVLGNNSVFVADNASIDPLHQAISLDPNFAMAYVALADIYKAGDYSGPEWRRGEEYALRAVALDPTLAEPHATLGFIRMFHYWDWAGAETEFKRAIELNPDCVTAHQWYALFHALRSNSFEAQGEIARAIELAPYSLVLYADLAEILYYGGRFGGYNGALKALLHVRQVFPYSEAFNELIRAYWMDGQFEKVNDFHTDVTRRVSAQDRARELAGPRKGSRAFEDISHPETFNHARWHAVLNQRTEAIELLEEAYSDHHFFIIYLKAEPFFDSLRDEPRFRELLRRVGLES